MLQTSTNKEVKIYLVAYSSLQSIKFLGMFKQIFILVENVSHMDSTIELSVIVLCYRAEESIIPFVDKLDKLISKLTSSYELVLVGNYTPGSDDRTKDIVLDLSQKNERYKAVIKPKQGMMGWDMLEGMKAAQGDYLCVIDGDGQFPIDSIENAFTLIKENQFDLVKTYRILRHDSLYRKMVSRIFNLLFALFFPGIKSKDVNSKPKIFTRRLYNKLDIKSTGWFIDAEIMIQMKRHRFIFEEFPVIFDEITDRASFVKFNANFEFIINLFKYRWQEFFIKK